MKPPWSKQAPGCSHSPAWLSPKNPAADPAPGSRLPSPSTRACPGDLIVLKHSSYRLIFRCPLSLVSDLHICWNTVGCSLCSSDQLGISLALRGSGLCSHLSRRHLPYFSNFSVLLSTIVSFKRKRVASHSIYQFVFIKNHFCAWHRPLDSTLP